jgi:hypothetical protein
MPSCYGCGKSGHVKSECPKLIIASRKSNLSFNEKRKGRRSHISWENNDNSSTLSDPDNSEIVDLCRMGHKHHEDFGSLAIQY